MTSAERVTSPTERRHPGMVGIDLVTADEVLRLINAEDQRVASAVAAALPALARVVELGVAALRSGGAVHYFGAGTSGRLAVLDAAELPPTFSLPPDRVVAHHAGGAAALVRAIENVEDDAAAGAAEAAVLNQGDLAIGLTASGRTPYVGGALRAARAAGAATALVSSNPDAPLARLADVHVAVDTGPEVIAGSTRMKAGTAQKLVLNAFSTAVMVQLGHTYSNLMAAMRVTNAKLRGRAVTILGEATGEPADVCAATLARADGDLRVALVCLLAGVTPTVAAEALGRAGGVVRTAVTLAGSPG